MELGFPNSWSVQSGDASWDSDKASQTAPQRELLRSGPESNEACFRSHYERTSNLLGQCRCPSCWYLGLTSIEKVKTGIEVEK